MDSKFVVVLFFGMVGLLQWQQVGSACYFPQPFQGEYVMQSYPTVNSATRIEYNNITIYANSISIWGNCHRRSGNNIILVISLSKQSCYRCLQLKLRSSNILQVFASSQEIISKCFTNEEAALQDCPSEAQVAETSGNSAEILLFKIKDEQQNTVLQKQYCPVDGKYYTNYKAQFQKDEPHECKNFKSTVDSCPSGSTLNFRLRSCSFPSYDLRIDCLGHWKGPRDEMYLVFIDSRYLEGPKPRYRCALYKQDKIRGKIEMALSRDSTCISELYNATSGFETFVLAPKAENPWPTEVSVGICSFPKWMHGTWEYSRVEGDTMVYKDHTSYKTYTFKCAGFLENTDKYLVFSRTQCDEEYFNCIRIANRSKNVFEFQIGINSKSVKDSSYLCDDSNFDNNWITQGRLDVTPTIQNNPCPITGEYKGRVPDAPDLCAKLWSDCRAPDLMYYQVSDCASEEIYEDRTYQCLGHWKESQLLYTYTERMDVADYTYECFVGEVESDKEIYIKEAGEHCQRNIDPLRHGMKLTMSKATYTCKDSSTNNPLISSFPSPRFSTTDHRYTTKQPGSKAASKPKDTSGANFLFVPSIICLSMLILINRNL